MTGSPWSCRSAAGRWRRCSRSGCSSGRASSARRGSRRRPAAPHDPWSGKRPPCRAWPRTSRRSGRGPCPPPAGSRPRRSRAGPAWLGLHRIGQGLQMLAVLCTQHLCAGLGQTGAALQKPERPVAVASSARARAVPRPQRSAASLTWRYPATVPIARSSFCQGRRRRSAPACTGAHAPGAG